MPKHCVEDLHWIPYTKAGYMRRHHFFKSLSLYCAFLFKHQFPNCCRFFQEISDQPSKHEVSKAGEPTPQTNLSMPRLCRSSLGCWIRNFVTPLQSLITTRKVAFNGSNWILQRALCRPRAKPHTSLPVLLTQKDKSESSYCCARTVRTTGQSLLSRWMLCKKRKLWFHICLRSHALMSKFLFFVTTKMLWTKPESVRPHHFLLDFWERIRR